MTLTNSFWFVLGPVTVPMVSTNSSPPIAMPVQVPAGHVVQQIVDDSGTLRHVILSPQHPTGLVPLTSHNPQHYVSITKKRPSFSIKITLSWSEELPQLHVAIIILGISGSLNWNVLLTSKLSPFIVPL